MSSSTPTQSFVPTRVGIENTGRVDDLLDYLASADYEAAVSEAGEIMVEHHPRQAPAATHVRDLALFLKMWVLMYPDALVFVDELRDTA